MFRAKPATVPFAAQPITSRAAIPRRTARPSQQSWPVLLSHRSNRAGVIARKLGASMGPTRLAECLGVQQSTLRYLRNQPNDFTLRSLHIIIGSEQEFEAICNDRNRNSWIGKNL